MQFYPQRTRTDCLLACLETLLWRPREELGNIEYYERKDKDGTAHNYLSYKSLLDITKSNFHYFKALPHDKIFYNNDYRQIVGFTYFDEINKRCTNHCVVAYGDKFFEPFTRTHNDIKELEKYKISYIITPFNRNYTFGDYTVSALTDWHEGMKNRLDENKSEQEQREFYEKLIGMKIKEPKSYVPPKIGFVKNGFESNPESPYNLNFIYQ